MIDSNDNWHGWFRGTVATLGFVGAYMALKSFVKFHNYNDNTIWWYDGYAVKYHESEDLTEALSLSCEIANEAIRNMIKKELA